MKRLRIAIVACLLFFCSFILGLIFIPGCSKEQPEPDEIKIAAAMPLTGDGAFYGEPQRKAAAMAVEEINNNGGLLGRKLILLAHDDKAQATEAVNLAHMFAANRDIAGVIGHPNSGNAIAASKIYHDHQIPYVATSPTNPTLTQQGFENVFRFAPTDDMQGISGAKFIFDNLKVDSIVVIHDNASYGKGLADGVKRHFESLGGKILLFDAIIAGERDYRSILSKVASLNPKVVFYGGMMPEGAVLVRQAKELGIDSQFVFGDGCFDEKLKGLAGTSCSNVYISFLAPPWEEVPDAEAFVKKYKERHRSVPPFAPYGYDAVLVLAEAIKKANSSRRENIIGALRDPEFEVQGVTGKIKFDKNGQTVGRLFYFYTFDAEGKLALKE